MDIITRANTTVLILDGSMATALEAQGVDTNNPLWTAAALDSNPQAVYQTHYDYFAAGAEVAITDSYQASLDKLRSLLKVDDDHARALITSAVTIAKQARDDYEQASGKHGFVAASVGPLGAALGDGSEYTGAYQRTRQQYLAFHRPRLEALLAGKPDCLAIETQPKLTEVLVLLDWLQDQVPQVPVYVSFSLRDGTHMADGTSLLEAASLVSARSQVFAVGINCVAPRLVVPALTTLRQATTKPLVAYPNRGAAYDPAAKQWTGLAPLANLGKWAREWRAAGAQLIGGCCTMGPDAIGGIARTLASKN